MFFTLNKLKLRYQPDPQTDVAYDATFKSSSGDAMQHIISQTPQDTHNIQSRQQPQSTDFNQYLDFNKQFSYKHTSTLTAQYNTTTAKT